MASTSPPPTTTPAHVPPHISPEVALQLRIRWLEALLLGVNNDLDKKAKADKDQKGKEKAKAKVKPALPRRIARAKKEGEEAKGGMGSIDDAGEDKDEDEEEEEEEEEDPDEQTLIRRAEEIQRKLDAVVEKNDDVARFVETCEFPKDRRGFLGPTFCAQTTETRTCSRPRSRSAIRTRRRLPLTRPSPLRTLTPSYRRWSPTFGKRTVPWPKYLVWKSKASPEPGNWRITNR